MQQALFAQCPVKGVRPITLRAKAFFGRLKTEMYYGRKWSGITPEKFMQHVDTYIRWYNERRIKLSLGTVSPEMYRQQCGLVQEIVRIPITVKQRGVDTVKKHNMTAVRKY